MYIYIYKYKNNINNIFQGSKSHVKQMNIVKSKINFRKTPLTVKRFSRMVPNIQMVLEVFNRAWNETCRYVQTMGEKAFKGIALQYRYLKDRLVLLQVKVL